MTEIKNTTEHGTMVRDQREEWPEDEPIGSFDIEQHRLQGYPHVTGHLIFVCPNGKRCAVLIGPNAVEPPHPDGCHTWAWDGDLERPTLTPSINCLAFKDGKPTSGCGWHGFIIKGVMK